VVARINNWLWVPAVGFMGTYLLMLFPDGRASRARHLRADRALPVSPAIPTLALTGVSGLIVVGVAV
jgi:hypothetical protein